MESEFNEFEILQTTCVRIKIREGAMLKVREWKDHLIENKAEVIQSLKQEGVFVESVFLEKAGDEYHLIYYMKMRDPLKSGEAFSKSLLEIDHYHKEFKKIAWETREELELLIDFVNPDF